MRPNNKSRFAARRESMVYYKGWLQKYNRFCSNSFSQLVDRANNSSYPLVGPYLIPTYTVLSPESKRGALHGTLLLGKVFSAKTFSPWRDSLHGALLSMAWFSPRRDSLH